MTRLRLPRGIEPSWKSLLLLEWNQGSRNEWLNLFPDWKQIAPPDENGSSFEENAAIKAKYYSGFTEELVLGRRLPGLKLSRFTARLVFTRLVTPVQMPRTPKITACFCGVLRISPTEQLVSYARWHWPAPVTSAQPPGAQWKVKFSSSRAAREDSVTIRCSSTLL